MAKIVFDEDKVTLGDLADYEQGHTAQQRVAFLAKFVLTDDDKECDPAEAQAFIRARSTPEGREIMAAFWQFMRGVKSDAVNPPTKTA